MILHITTQAEWDAACAAGTYRPASLAREGFIHTSTAAQAVATANAYFRGRHDLVLLCIDETKVEAEIRYEHPSMSDPRAAERFPHIYGALSPAAVVDVVAFPCDAERGFMLPSGLDGDHVQREDETAK